MKRILACALLLLVIGCSANAVFVGSVDRYWSTIGPEYRTYIENDATISDAARADFLRTAEMFSELINREKEALE